MNPSHLSLGLVFVSANPYHMPGGQVLLMCIGRQRVADTRPGAEPGAQREIVNAFTLDLAPFQWASLSRAALAQGAAISKGMALEISAESFHAEKGSVIIRPLTIAICPAAQRRKASEPSAENATQPA